MKVTHVLLQGGISGGSEVAIHSVIENVRALFFWKQARFSQKRPSPVERLRVRDASRHHLRLSLSGHIQISVFKPDVTVIAMKRDFSFGPGLRAVLGRLTHPRPKSYR